MSDRSHRRRLAACAPLALLLAASTCPPIARGAAPPGSETASKANVAKSEAGLRTFRFTYRTTVVGLEPRAAARIWIPLAPSTAHQEVQIEKVDVPGESRRTAEQRFRNPLLHVECQADAAGRIPLEVVQRVARREVAPANYEAATEPDRKTFLAADALVPVSGKPVDVVIGSRAPTGSAEQVARILYDRVDERVAYRKPPGEPWGRGDAAWVCESGFGNCTDFHSLFISACRSQGLPAKFEMGFAIPVERGRGSVAGYHCWAFYAADGRWRPVDISEADKRPDRKDYFFGRLDPDRVAFTTGRDLLLDPPQRSGAVNFLIHPHVEVDGKPHAKFEPDYRYEDVE